MSNKGYVYVMINPSMPGLVKIGKTTREPEKRVKELSSFTGVPTEFTLVYKRLVNDCTVAENYIHEVLQTKGVRVSQKREFFEMPIYEAVEVIQQYTDNEQCESALSTANVYALNILKEALSYYHGYDDFLEDKYQALKLFKKAINLGLSAGYLFIGRMYLYDEIESNNNIKDALKYFSEGSLKGENRCFAEMGIIYLASYYNNYNLENGLKCWKKYFNNIDIEYITKNDISYFKMYLELIRINGIPLEEKELLSFVKNRIIDDLINQLNIYQDSNNIRFKEFHVERLKENIDYVNANLKEPKDTIYAEYLNKLNAIISPDLFEVSDKVCIVCEVVSGYIHRGDSIIVSSKYGKKSTKVLAIEYSRKLIDFAEVGMHVGLLLEGNINEFNFIVSEGGSLTSID